MSRLREALEAGARKLELSISQTALEQFEAYYAYLAEQNQVMDLTAVQGEEETALRHFADSLTLLRCESFSDQRVLDVGSGAGFPGLPLKLCCPELRLCLLDSQGKRVEFLRALCQRLGVEVSCIQARAEELALLPEYREQYDRVLSRAVARLNLLGELCLPFVKPGGCFLAMKAADCDEELDQARPGLGTLGAKLEQSRDFVVGDTPRRVLLLRKTHPTPAIYPRRYAKMLKKPL